MTIEFYDVLIMCIIKLLLYMNSNQPRVFLQLLDSEEHKKLLGSRKRIATWMSDVEAATKPQFTEVHEELSGYCKYVDSLRAPGDFN